MQVIRRRVLALPESFLPAQNFWNISGEDKVYCLKHYCKSVHLGAGNQSAHPTVWYIFFILNYCSYRHCFKHYCKSVLLGAENVWNIIVPRWNDNEETFIYCFFHDSSRAGKKITWLIITHLMWKSDFSNGLLFE